MAHTKKKNTERRMKLYIYKERRWEDKGENKNTNREIGTIFYIDL